MCQYQEPTCLRVYVHRVYVKRALMKIPSLEQYEREAAAKVEAAGYIGNGFVSEISGAA
jgi:hypothetical protein